MGWENNGLKINSSFFNLNYQSSGLQKLFYFCEPKVLLTTLLVRLLFVRFTRKSLLLEIFFILLFIIINFSIFVESLAAETKKDKQCFIDYATATIKCITSSLKTDLVKAFEKKPK